MRFKDPIFQSVIAPNIYDRHRRPIIKRLQRKLGAKLIVYTANPTHPIAHIMIQDVPLFEDLLRSVAGAEKGCLMINSPGGDANAAEKLLTMCRVRFTKGFSVIVPDYAKSAAAMIALGSDKILMGYLAELGPIDPQLRTAPPPLPGETIPARSFIDGLEIIRKKVQEDGDPVQMYYPMMAQIRPEILARCQSAIDGSRELAEKWLKKYMLKDDPRQAELVAKWLSTGEKYKSHGKVIDFEEAKNVLKLNVEKIDPNSDLWSDVWELYCRSTQFLQQVGPPVDAKLYESESVSLRMSIQAVMIRAPRLPARPPPSQPPQRPTPQPPKSPPQ
ncbi:MAG: Serine dehydrogenase proteinase [Candidatus Bathyarchaeota archaeon BA2]|nr:MAG: Serine dehydrogenase proteinase [Candidatus Bathyarchaeota archaeon BA2]